MTKDDINKMIEKQKQRRAEWRKRIEKRAKGEK